MHVNFACLYQCAAKKVRFIISQNHNRLSPDTRNVNFNQYSLACFLKMTFCLCSVLIETEMCQHILLELPSKRFRENRSAVLQFFNAYRRTDVAVLNVRSKECESA